MSRFYDHLGLDERQTIYQMLQRQRTASEIATSLGRHVSTIRYEIKRNRHLDEHPAFRRYFNVTAHDKAGCRQVRDGKIARDAALATFVEARLSDYWSPEQIADYLRASPDSGLSVCHETIYQFVYGAQGYASQLGRLLPSRRRVRRRRYARRPRGMFISLQNTIGERTRFGDWEGNLEAIPTRFARRDGADFGRMQGTRREPCFRIVTDERRTSERLRERKLGAVGQNRPAPAGSPGENRWTSSRRSHGEPPRASPRS